MSSFVPEAWPDDLRDVGLVARDICCAVVDRRRALQRLGEALGGKQLADSARDQILSLAAGLLSVANQDSSIQDEAARAIDVTIREVARLVAARLQRNPITTDLREDAEGLICQRLKEGKFDPDRGGFKQWCYTVLRNELNTRLRRVQVANRAASGAWSVSYPTVGWRTQAPAQVDAESADWRPDFERRLDAREFLRTPFSGGDLDRISKMKLPARLALMCMFGLWTKVPCWADWVEESGVAMPFPPEEFHEMVKQGDQEEWLAGALGVSKTAITQVRYRASKLLASLESLQSSHHE